MAQHYVSMCGVADVQLSPALRGVGGMQKRGRVRELWDRLLGRRCNNGRRKAEKRRRD